MALCECLLRHSDHCRFPKLLASRLRMNNNNTWHQPGFDQRLLLVVVHVLWLLDLLLLRYCDFERCLLWSLNWRFKLSLLDRCLHLWRCVTVHAVIVECWVLQRCHTTPYGEISTWQAAVTTTALTCLRLIHLFILLNEAITAGICFSLALSLTLCGFMILGVLNNWITLCCTCVDVVILSRNFLFLSSNSLLSCFLSCFRL